MRTIAPALLAHLKGDATSIALCWVLEKTNGVLIRGTEHDQDIVVAGGSPDDLHIGGTYYARSGISASDFKYSSDGSVDNTEVAGAFATDPLVMDVSLADLNAGLLSAAAVVVFAVNWRAPSMGYYLLQRGYLGQPTHTTDGGYTVEIRSLSQSLTQNVCQSYSEGCNVIRFGDARCKFDVESTRIAGVVTAVTSRRLLAVSMPGGSPSPLWSYSGGLLTMSSGLNDTYEREVKYQPSAQVDGLLELWDSLPADVAVGDTFSVVAGCDRSYDTCLNVFHNLINFRGYGVFIPGVMALTQGPV